MSTDPTGLGNENCVSATSKKYIHLDLSDRNLWCRYKGECLIDNLIFNKEMACLLCVWRAPLKIPDMLDEKMNKRLTKEFRRKLLKRKFTL